MIEVTDLIIIMGVPSAVTALAFGALQRRIIKSEEKREKKDAAREKSQVLIIKSVGAAIALGESTAIALKNGKTNGETEKALEYAQQVKHEQKDFLAEIAAMNLY